MNPKLLANLASAMFLAGACSEVGESGRRSPAPNIVLMVADDLGWHHVGYHGGVAATPHIDALARDGLELHRFYSSPICVASRAGLMTGRYPIRFGMQERNVRTHKGKGLPPEEKTLPEYLDRAGYERRAILGKWHLGSEKGANHPLDSGFTDFYGTLHAGVDHLAPQNWQRQREGVAVRGYAADLLGEEARAFIEACAREQELPFLLYLPFQAVHAPHQAPSRYDSHYPDLSPSQATFARMVTCMDEAVGEVLAALEENGLSENTIVWFTSDNGGSVGPASNWPLRGVKATAYEGGIRVPSAVRWPAGGWSGGRRVDALVSYIDVVPTLLSAVGARLSNALDGIDVGRVLAGSEHVLDRELFTMVQTQRQLQAAVNTPEWKLVHTGDRLESGLDPAGKVELYRIDQDPRERTDLAGADPERTRTMRESLAEFFALR